MADDLKDKLSQVKDAHAAEIVDRQGDEFAEQARIEAAFILGRIKQNDHIRQGIGANLEAQTILALDRFQEEKKYKALGFDKFDEFLDKSPLSPMTKTQYYTRRGLINMHGAEVYDLLTAVGISVRAQKMLGKGELSIKGDRLVIGDEEIEVANSGLIKEVLEELVDEKREMAEELGKAQRKIAKQKEQIDQGVGEYEMLQRHIDELQTGDPHDIALSRVISKFLELHEAIGQMPDADKAAKGGNALRTLFTQLEAARRSYGLNISYTDDQPIAKPSDGAPSLTARILAEDDDFADEDEV